jgi:hypothetical protein
MRILLSLSVVCCIVAAACAPEALPTSRQIGVLNIKDTTDGAGGYITRSTGVFWTARNVTLPSSRSTPDSCIDTTYQPPPTETASLSNQLDAGTPIAQASDLATNMLSPDTTWGTLNGTPYIKLITYRGSAAGLAYTPGADITFTIPGAAGGFPAGTVRALTAKRLILGPIDPNPPPDSMQLTWVQGTPGTTLVQMQLLYNVVIATYPTRQLLCSMYDDGSFWLNKQLTAKWQSGYGKYQKVTAFRFVTTAVSGANSSLVVAIAEFDTVKTTFP